MADKADKLNTTGNGFITISKGKMVISVGSIITILYVLMNFAPLRGNNSTLEDRVVELEACHRESLARNEEQFKHINEKLKEISAKLDKE